jgi:hypothetical protein
MPTEVYEDALPLEIDILEAVALTSASQREYRSAYPFPWLRNTGSRKQVEVRVVILESNYLRVTIAIDLGGRILEILDKRTSTNILGLGASLPVQVGGPRGAQILGGLLWQVGEGRLNSLGPVEHLIVDASSEEAPAGVWLADLGTGSGVSVHFGVSLPPDRAEILLEMRAFNRDLGAKQYRAQIAAVPFGDEALTRFPRHHGRTGIYRTQARAGLSFGFNPIEVQGELGAQALLSRSFPTQILMPRQLDTWTASVTPISGIDGVSAVSADASIHVGDSLLGIQATAPLLGAKAVILTASGETLEAAIDLYPERIEQMDLTGVTGVEGVVILDSARRELLRWERNAPSGSRSEEPQVCAFEDLVAKMRDDVDPTPFLPPFASDLGLRSSSFAVAGIWHLRNADTAAAATAFEESLLYNGEDHLAWWMKAMSDRLAGLQAGDELLNAHFLAPLEPVLRAESYLRNPSQEKAASAILKPLADNPEAFIEVACQLHDCGLGEELSKWTEECLRHREVPMLRYLLAHELLRNSRMKAEGAQQVVTASKAPINPPYPWRDLEKKVIRELLVYFPEDQRLRDLSELIAWVERA